MTITSDLMGVAFITLAFAFKNSTYLQTAVCETTISVMMVPMASTYNIGPNQYFGSFALGGYDNITGDGDGMFCRI